MAQSTSHDSVKSIYSILDGPGRSLALGVAACVFLALLPFLWPFVGDVVILVGFIIGLAAVYFISRPLTRGWAVLAAISSIVTFAWSSGLSTYFAHEWSWQGMNIRDRSMSGFEGNGSNLFLWLIFLTILAPILGLLIGLFSQVRKKRPALAAES